MSQFHILVVDDEPDIRELVKEILEDEGYIVSVADNGESARQQVNTKLPDLVLLDIWMPDEDGISLLRHWHKGQSLPFPVIVMSGHGTIDTAVEATRLGASSFIEKPLTTAKLLQAVRNVLPQKSNVDALRIPAGTSKIATELRSTAKNMSESKVTVMIYGPAGIGKEDFAHYIHAMSQYSNRLFVVVDEAFDLNLLTNGDEYGSLFIKNIAMFSEARQQQLATIINTLKQQEIDFRLMSSDKLRLKILTEQKMLYAPLVELLEGKEIFLPPLSERNEDIPDLIGACIDYQCQKNDAPYRRFSIAAQNFLRYYPWPENMRELDGLVVYLLETGEGEQITVEEVRQALKHTAADSSDEFNQLMFFPLKDAREAFERIYLKYHLQKADGNVKRLSSVVGIERTHLYRKLKSLGIQFDGQEGTE